MKGRTLCRLCASSWCFMSYHTFRSFFSLSYSLFFFCLLKTLCSCCCSYLILTVWALFHSKTPAQVTHRCWKLHPEILKLCCDCPSSLHKKQGTHSNPTLEKFFPVQIVTLLLKLYKQLMEVLKLLHVKFEDLFIWGVTWRHRATDAQHFFCSNLLLIFSSYLTPQIPSLLILSNLLHHLTFIKSFISIAWIFLPFLLFLVQVLLSYKSVGILFVLFANCTDFS